MQKLPKDFQILIVATIAGAITLMWILFPEIRWESWPEFLLFAVLIAIAAMLPIPSPKGGAFVATSALFYLLFTMHGPGAGVLIGGFAYTVGTAVSRNWVPWRRLYNGAQMGIGAAFGGTVFRVLGGSLDTPGLLTFLLPFALAAFAHQLTNTFFVSLFFSRLRNTPMFSMWMSDVKDFLLSDILGIPSAALLAVLYVSVHPSILILYLASLPLQRWAIQLYLEQKRMFDQAINSIVVAIDSDFPEGRGHSKRVADVAVGIARKLNLSDGEVETIEMGALLHDVGMIGLIDAAEEAIGEPEIRSSRLQEHVRLGAGVAQHLPSRGPAISEIILSHHENFDGSGFPHHLKGSQIPLGARIVALAEGYESILSSEVHRAQELSPAQAAAKVKEQSGTMYDPRVVSAFSEAFAEGLFGSKEDSSADQILKALSGSGATQ